MEPLIIVDDLVKTYRIGVGRARVREMTPPPIDAAFQQLFRRWWLKDTFEALDGVSLRVPAGTGLGVIGHNGAGKTTLLKLIAGVTAPTRGSIAVRGRVAALLDVTVGFHPDLTGRENLFVAAGMHGLSRKDVAGRVDRILEFAELDEFIDTPVKRYSAGMVARLAFGMVAALDADVLLIDEVLAVGDASFQRKCIAWLDEYRERGGTVVFVSHNLSLIRHMTERAVWLDHGRVRADGPTASVLSEYAQQSERRHAAMGPREHRNARRVIRQTGLDRWGAGGVRVSEADVSRAGSERGLVVTIRYVASTAASGRFSVGLVDEAGHEVGASLSPEFGFDGESGELKWTIERLPLRPGIYFPVVSVLSPTGQIFDRWKLERAVVLDANGHQDLAQELGPTEFEGAWMTGGRDVLVADTDDR